MAADETPEDTPKKPSDVVELPDGEALSWEAAQAEMRARPVHLVVLAGAAESGKTTILTSLYELFLQAPVGGTSFSGSNTLVGFERRCHEGRLASGRSEATTLRTPTGDGFRFLHLRLADGGETPSTHDLLLSDVSGEFFRAAADTTDGCKRLTFLPYADKLVVVLDGEKVAKQELRFRALADVRMVVKGILDARMLSRGTSITLVLSKLDSILNEQGLMKPVEALDELKEQLSALAEKNRMLFSFLPVAAQPKSQAVPFAHGVPLLVKSWIDELPQPTRPHAVSVFREPPSRRTWSLAPRSWREIDVTKAPYELDFI